MLTVYKASAGSGKTFQLVAGYLKLLIKNSVNYRHILAVTFTNKATNEMKNRILEQLYRLASNKDSAYLELLKKEVPFKEETIRKRAKQTLRNILHDYGRFSVSTIDSFTQRIIKAFNREMGISPYFTLELDNDIILEEAVDRMLSKIDSDKQLLHWLSEFSEEKIKENKSQRIEEDIKSLGKELFKEKFQIFFPYKDDTIYTRENLESFRNELVNFIARFENTIRSKGKTGVNIFLSHGLEMNDFSGKGRGIGGFWVKLAEGYMPNITNTIKECASNTEKWYTQRAGKKDQIHQIVERRLQPLLNEILSFFDKYGKKYYTAREVLKQLRVLGILTDLKEEIRELLHEKGVLQLSDSNLLLSKIIGNSESPFIYEKIGARYYYFMLDEFQDTSALQWNNFKPLLSNSLAEGYPVLLVGDIKQSIYRWRNSDWDILATQINHDFSHYPPQEIALEKNWRSQLNIIDFNNEIISMLKHAFEDFLFSELENHKYREKFHAVYQNFLQEPGDPGIQRTGMSEISFLPGNDFEENACKLLIKQVKQLQGKGLKASDITILIRKNNEGAKIIQTFLAASRLKENACYNLSILSNESLFLYASQGVNFVILVIELLIDPNSKIPRAALLNLWLSWLKPALKNRENISPGDNRSAKEVTTKEQNNWLIENDFETDFDRELGQQINQLKKEIMLMSLDETVIKICALFRLFEIEGELPFMQTLIDQSAQVKTSLSNDLSNFLIWWKEKGYKVSVSVNEDVDSIRLLTVHKAKGLEFEAVLIPFFNWDTSWIGNQSPLLWCKSQKEPFDKFPLLPVRAGKNLINTYFKNDYLEEKINTYIDTLNLIYVAFTRAKSALFINCKDPGYPGKPGKTVNSLLKHSLDRMVEINKFNGCWNNDKTIFRFGELPVVKSIEISQEADYITKYYYCDFLKKIRMLQDSEEFIISDGENRSLKNTGKLVHEILSSVETADDIESACNKAFRQGKITAKETKIILNKLIESLKNPLISNWFSGNYRILNERNLITPYKISRPDRIMISGKDAIIVDYKWGEKMPEKYRKQVSIYANTMKKCGYAKVKGYLWYINLDEVEKAGEW